ncbi:unnamed protein product [Macrosiphum euphorbiae]|uniref:Uncharacterized protein n=1 Tax=Macrosiphum euphorbiae TaxID=13131 RepID=A0AAV0XR41_9HEMI|nr:unnamed protein product [Macrosiphum euphorbiae]
MIMEQDQSTEPPPNKTYSTRAYYEQPTTAAYYPLNLASIQQVLSPILQVIKAKTLVLVHSNSMISNCMI